MKALKAVNLCVRSVVVAAFIFTNSVASAQYKFPFQDPALPVDARVNNLLSLMTVQEKIACLSTDPQIPRLGVVGTRHVEGLHGLAMGGPGGWGRPTIVPTTQFPQAVGLGETWDPELLRKVAAAEGFETRYMFQSKYHQGGLVVRAPNADLARDIRWGRTEESYGEDPYLTGTMVVAFAKGLQGDDSKYWLTASLMKHFLANSNEDGRGGSSSDFDERLLREYYSVPFRMGIEEGGSRAFMAAYNAYNGIPMTVQPLLREIAVNEWGNNGIICTDAGAMTNLVKEFKRYSTLEEAAAAAVKAGIGQFLDDYKDAVTQAFADKLLTEADLDRVLRGDLRVMVRLGQLDPPSMVPYSKIGEGPEPWNSAEHQQLARLVTQESIVLLKNAKGTLPLHETSLKSVAVIGPYADQVLLDWYSGTPPYAVSALDGIRNRLGTSRVRFARNDDQGVAIQLARESDVAIVVVGNHPECDAGWAVCPLPSDGKEAVDRKSITLEQEELVKHVYEANPRTILVLIASFPYAINWSTEHVPAILQMTHNSEELGNALADVLFGDYNPAGRLVHTWPRSLEQLPPIMDYNLRDGRTYMYFKGEPLYPFGYGLSYTKFSYGGNLRIVQGRGNDAATVDVDVTNSGDRAGDEVVQLYASYPDSSVSRPKQQLVGFRRIRLGVGETKTVRMAVSRESIAYWNTTLKRFVVEGTKIKLMVGASAKDIRLEKTIKFSKESSLKQ